MNKTFWFGMIITATISALGIWSAGLAVVKMVGFSAVTMAIIFGMIVGNTLYPKFAIHCHDGVTFSKGQLLRLGIILYGFRLTFQEISDVGIDAIIADAVIVSSTFFFTWLIGRKLFHIDAQTVILIGAGSSICGAAAVMATEPVVKAHAHKVAVAVATVVVFGTVAIFWYPHMYQMALWPFTGKTYGVYIGSSVHEVAQVYAAGNAISQLVADAAVATKMIRVMMLAPFLFVLSWWVAKRHDTGGVQKSRLVIPWFAVLFIAVAGFNSFDFLPTAWVRALQFIDTILLTMAMAALGLTTHFGAIRQAGAKPIALGALIMVWLILVGGIIQVVIS